MNINSEDQRMKALNVPSMRSNWLDNLNWQIDFYRRSSTKNRTDSEFDWAWLIRRQKSTLRGFAEYFAKEIFLKLHLKYMAEGVLSKLHLPYSDSQEWLNKNAGLLWESRTMLEDDLSKLLFDSMLVLRCTDSRQFYFPRIDFDDLVSVVSEERFLSSDLPRDHLGLPLRMFSLQLSKQPNVSTLNILSVKVQVDLLNSYRQYFLRRNSLDLSPAEDDVVLDCGAGIGEFSMLFAGLVGKRGAVHLFDPLPLNARYCHLQASLNPLLAHVLHINALAVGDTSREVVGARHDSGQISPGGIAVDSFAMTSIDDYVAKKKLSRVNVIKMDIEGAEMAAIKGAEQVVREFKPRLAISVYHKPEDLWEIPHKLKEQNGNYRFYFGHHSPLEWESIYYAVDRCPG